MSAIDRPHRQASETVVYHSHWTLDLHHQDTTRSSGRATLQFAFSRVDPGAERIEGAAWGRIELDGATAVIERGRCVLRRVGGRSHLRVDLPFVDGAGRELALRAWCEGSPHRLPPSGADAGHALLVGPQGEVLATGAIVLHVRVFLEQLLMAPPRPTADTQRMLAVLRTNA